MDLATSFLEISFLTIFPVSFSPTDSIVVDVPYLDFSGYLGRSGSKLLTSPFEILLGLVSGLLLPLSEFPGLHSSMFCDSLSAMEPYLNTFSRACTCDSDVKYNRVRTCRNKQKREKREKRKMSFATQTSKIKIFGSSNLVQLVHHLHVDPCFECSFLAHNDCPTDRRIRVENHSMS